MKKYATMLGAVSPAASRVNDIVAALSPPERPSSTSALVRSGGNPSLMDTAKKAVPGVIGAVAGYMVWKRHPILGAVLGHAVGSNAMALYSGSGRKQALYGIAVEGAAVLGALKYKRHPVLGFIGGLVAGGAVTAVIAPDSPARGVWERIKR